MFGRRATETQAPARAAPARAAPSPQTPAEEASEAALETAAKAPTAPPATATPPPTPARTRREGDGVDADREAKAKAFYEIKDSIYAALIETIDITQLSTMTREKAEEEVTDIVKEIMQLRRISLPIVEQDILLRQINEDLLGYGPLDPLIARDDIADIMVNGTEPIFIEVAGKMEQTHIRFRSKQQLLNVCQKIVGQVGRRVDESSPICDARLLDGSRVNVIAPPLAIDGTSLTIRKFKKDKLTLDKLVQFGSITTEGAQLLRIIGRVRCNVLISGGTGSGKTTLLNCLTNYVDDEERIVTCEDSAELQLQQPHVVRLETRPPNIEGNGEISMRQLVKNCLRMRPERIIVGEVRGPEAFDLLQAMNTGHDGSMGTLHANSPREAIARMEAMITMGGFSLPASTIRQMIVSSIDVIVQAARLRDGSRRITHITEVIGMEGEVPILQDLFIYDIEGEDTDGNIVGRHKSTGVTRPKMWDRARYYREDAALGSVLEAAAVPGS